MDRRLLFPSYLNTNHNRLIKAASFSELSMIKKVTTEQQYSFEKGGNLVKQYSCEEIYDKKSITRQVRTSHVLKSNNEEYQDTWLSMFPTNLSSNISNSSSEDKTSFLQESFSFPKQIAKTPDNRSLKPILAPAKFVVDAKKSDLLSIDNPKSFVSHSHTGSVNNQDDKFDFYSRVSLPSIRISNMKNGIFINKTTDDKVMKDDTGEHTKQNTVDTTELKKRLRCLVRVEPEKRKHMICSWWSFKFIVLLSIVIASLAYFLNAASLSKKFCNPKFEFHEISEDLKNHVYSQESAIDELTKYLRDINNKTGFNVIALLGGIGVGKSYTAEIVKNRMKATSNIIDVFPPLINKEVETFASLSVCRCNLIRLENLKTDDIPDAAVLINKLKKKAEDYCVLVLALFNTQETDEHLIKTLDLNKSISLIEQTFRERKLEITLISYKSMSSEALTKCINDAADYSNVKLTNTDVENIRRDMLIANSGCKGVYPKVQLRSSSEV